MAGSVKAPGSAAARRTPTSLPVKNGGIGVQRRGTERLGHGDMGWQTDAGKPTSPGTPDLSSPTSESSDTKKRFVCCAS